MTLGKSPCAVCQYSRRKCTKECVFAPYFPSDQPLKFTTVHNVYGSSNVAKILHALPTADREDAVNSLVYEADARLKNPVYGCVGSISILQKQLNQVQTALQTARQELATYMGPAAQSAGMMPILDPNMQPSLGQIGVGQDVPSNMHPTLGIQGHGSSLEAQNHKQIYDDAQQQQLVNAAREQEMMRNLEQQNQRLQLQQQQVHQGIDLMRFNRGFDVAGPSGFTQLTGPNAAMYPSLALGGSYDNMYHIQQQPEASHVHNQHHHQQQLIPQELLVHQQPQPQHEQPQPQPQPHHGDRKDESP